MFKSQPSCPLPQMTMTVIGGKEKQKAFLIDKENYAFFKENLVYHKTISASSSFLSCCTYVGRPSPIRGFWFGNSPPGNSSFLSYWVTHRLCLRNAALLRNLASEPARGRQFEPGISLKPVNCPVLFTVLVFWTWIWYKLYSSYNYFIDMYGWMCVFM